jgi:hypothetical protein
VADGSLDEVGVEELGRRRRGLKVNSAVPLRLLELYDRIERDVVPAILCRPTLAKNG